MSLLECKNVTKKYKNIEALKAINLEIDEGKIVGLLGPNGSGKTTLIKLICDLLTLDKGEILVKGHRPGVETKKFVSYLPDKISLNTQKSVKYMINYYADFFSLDFDIGRATNMLNALGIDLDAKIKSLSKGNQEKVVLILAMSRNADLYILDEPIAGVDPATRDYILKTIITNYNPTASIIISTHLIADVESILSDVVFIDHGTIVLTDTVDNIRERENKSVDEYFREAFRC